MFGLILSGLALVSVPGCSPFGVGGDNDTAAVVVASVNEAYGSVFCDTDPPAVRRFQQRLAQNGLQTLAANRRRLQDMERSYADRQSAGDRAWVALRAAIAHDRALAVRAALVDSVLRYEMAHMGFIPPTVKGVSEKQGFAQRIEALGIPASVFESRRTAEAYIAAIDQRRAEVRTAVPALVFLNTRGIPDEQTNADVMASLRSGLAEAYEAIDETAEGIRNGDFPLQEMDPVVAQTQRQLEDEGLNAAARGQIEDWLGCESNVHTVIRWGTTIVAAGLGVAAFFATGPVALVVGLAGAGAGAAGAGYELERADDIYGAARAGKGGDALVDESIADAQTAVLMASLDLGLSAVGIGAAARSAMRTGSAVAKVTDDAAAAVPPPPPPPAAPLNLADDSTQFFPTTLSGRTVQLGDAGDATLVRMPRSFAGTDVAVYRVQGEAAVVKIPKYAGAREVVLNEVKNTRVLDEAGIPTSKIHAHDPNGGFVKVELIEGQTAGEVIAGGGLTDDMVDNLADLYTKVQQNEIGLDLSHGGNLIWNEARREFVVIDKTFYGFSPGPQNWERLFFSGNPEGFTRFTAAIGS